MMSFKEIFNLNYPFFRIRLDNENGENVSPKNSDIEVSSIEELTEDTKNEWHQEYELIYLSYVLER
jgi:hypothetical protein